MTGSKKDGQPVAEVLNDAAESIDAATLSKLRQARYHALEQEPGVNPVAWWSSSATMVTGGGVAAVAVVAMLSFWLIGISPHTRVQAIEDVELLASLDNTELYEEMDFYEWLESQQKKQHTDAG